MSILFFCTYCGGSLEAEDATDTEATRAAERDFAHDDCLGRARKDAALTTARVTFAQIARWSSDPRARAEAERMAAHLTDL